MPPRISVTTLFDSLSINPSLQRSCSSKRSASTVAQKHRKHADPYALAQSKARKAANLSRQSVLREERAKALGSPIHGFETPFLRSFDTGLPIADPAQSTSPLDPPTSDPASASANAPGSSSSEHLNHFVSVAGLRDSLKHSERLSAPVSNSLRKGDPVKLKRERESYQAEAQNAREALARITAVENASSKDRMHVNIQRCIDTFGRHNTDKTLRPRPPISAQAGGATESSEEGAQKIIERAGSDTGSSEVQIAILTAKIRTLAQNLETRGRKDKMNKRNLRLLVHRRQRLLRYLRRSERGGERWQNLIQTLGLTEGTWRGEISL